MDFRIAGVVHEHGGVGSEARGCRGDRKNVEQLELVLLVDNVFEKVVQAQGAQEGVEEAGKAH